jgi:hypothetical protein
MKMGKFIVFIILVAIVAVNAVSVSRNIDCSYSNSSGSFTFEEMNLKERNFEMCMRKFSEFKKQSADTVLYRLCKKNFLKFWNWSNYIFQKKFKLPYKSWKEIDERRGMVNAKSGFQDF